MSDLDFMKNLNDVKAKLRRVEEKNDASIRRLFKELGGDYDTHFLILNRDCFPQDISLNAHKNIKYAPLPKHCPGLFFEDMTKDLFKPVGLIEESRPAGDPNKLINVETLANYIAEVQKGE